MRRRLAAGQCLLVAPEPEPEPEPRPAPRLFAVEAPRPARPKPRRLRPRPKMTAKEGVRKLVADATWEGDSVHIDVDVLLGPVTDTKVKHLVFHVGDAVIPMPRSRLLQCRRVLRVFPDLSARIDASDECVRFDWHDGHGRLRLRGWDERWTEDGACHVSFGDPPC